MAARKLNRMARRNGGLVADREPVAIPGPVGPRSRPHSDDFTPAQRRTLFIASAGVCSLCGRQTRWDAKSNEPDSFVIGHVVPAWRGGKPTMDNARPECRHCSMREVGRIRGRASANAARRRLGLADLEWDD